MSLENFTNSIDITVETIWKGKVGVRDRYVDQAVREKKDLHITHGNKTMIIPYNNILTRIMYKSNTPFKDRYSKAEHYLYYYSWAFNPKPVVVAKAPEFEQLSLF